MVIVLMGVSGSGKSTVGQRLAEALGWSFYDGDDYHPDENIAKMTDGTALTDTDRRAWLDALRKLIDEHLDEGIDAVIACSALRTAYRRRLGTHRPDVQLVYLKGSFDLIYGRMQARTDHFMPPTLLRSQFDTLEEPEAAVVVPIDAGADAVVTQIRGEIGV